MLTDGKTDADRDAETRFAATYNDSEYLYPPVKWGGAPYVARSTTAWPDAVEARLKSLEAVQNLDGERLARLEAIAEQVLVLLQRREDERK